ncbi:MAG: HAMP domain-containing histidine kinase [Lachnospiraceae bacterium]|nr:HAMP domain-containing histidine kinase [Lachnospiraceae bacterium]
MKRKQGWIWAKYLVERKKLIGMGAVLYVIWAAIAFLTHESLENALYLTALWLFVVLVYGIRDYLNYRERYLLILHLRKEICESVEHLPQAEGIQEEQYQELLRIVHGDKMDQLFRADQTRKDLVEYFTMWVHQIKTPIAGMRLLLQMSESPEREELQGELFRIEQYVDMVLVYLRLGAESTDLVIQKYDVAELVRKTVKIFAGQFIRKKLSVKMDDVSGYVITDEKWFRFVVEQLISNAIKYTDQGSVVISWQENTLCISDSGIGIAAEDLPRIFEKGYTGYNGRMDKKSTGIGLYLCYQTMEKLGGSIRVESEVDQGTRFYLIFPPESGLYE